MVYSASFIVFLVVINISLSTSSAPKHKPWEPVPVINNTHWTWAHSTQSDLITANTVSNKAQLIFLGDSITALWLVKDWGKSVWEKEYATPYHALNLGIGGDKTENLLWRIQNSNLSLLNNPPPKVAIVCIGTNNIAQNNATDDDIVKGIVTIVSQLRNMLPSTKILILGLFPRQTFWFFVRVANINLKLARIDQKYRITDNSTSTTENDENMIVFFDMWTHFASSMKSVVPEYFAKDKVHLNSKGYQKWAQLMNKTLSEMMN